MVQDWSYISYDELSDADKKRVDKTDCHEDVVTGEKVVPFCETCVSQSQKHEPENWGFEKEHMVILDAGIVAWCKQCDKYDGHVYGLELESRVHVVGVKEHPEKTVEPTTVDKNLRRRLRSNGYYSHSPSEPNDALKTLSDVADILNEEERVKEYLLTSFDKWVKEKRAELEQVFP